MTLLEPLAVPRRRGERSDFERQPVPGDEPLEVGFLEAIQLLGEDCFEAWSCVGRRVREADRVELAQWLACAGLARPEPRAPCVGRLLEDLPLPGLRAGQVQTEPRGERWFGTGDKQKQAGNDYQG